MTSSPGQGATQGSGIIRLTSQGYHFPGISVDPSLVSRSSGAASVSISPSRWIFAQVGSGLLLQPALECLSRESAPCMHSARSWNDKRGPRTTVCHCRRACPRMVLVRDGNPGKRSSSSSVSFPKNQMHENFTCEASHNQREIILGFAAKLFGIM